jgi:hypothetical protein
LSKTVLKTSNVGKEVERVRIDFWGYVAARQAETDRGQVGENAGMQINAE